MFVLVVGPHTQSLVCLLLANCITVKRVKRVREGMETTIQLCWNILQLIVCLFVYLSFYILSSFVFLVFFCLFCPFVFLSIHHSKFTLCVKILKLQWLTHSLTQSLTNHHHHRHSSPRMRLMRTQTRWIWSRWCLGQRSKGIRGRHFNDKLGTVVNGFTVISLCSIMEFVGVAKSIIYSNCWHFNI